MSGNPVLSWYIKENDETYSCTNSYYAGSCIPNQDFIIQIQIWNNRWNIQNDVDNINNAKLILTFEHAEDSILFQLCEIKIDDNNYIKPTIETINKATVNIGTIYGTKNAGTILDKDNYNNPKKVNEFSYTMLVNKHHVLDKKFVPQNLKTVSTEYASDKGVKANNTAIAQAKKMIDAAKKEDKNIIINSAYRSYEEQEEVVNTYQELYGDEYIEKYVLKPGFSEHQTGLGIDFGSTDTKIFIQSDEYKWMEENCYKYGFIHRFKSSYEDITGIKSEAWHYRYVGKKAAKYMYENDISLEEYYIKFIEK